MYYELFVQTWWRGLWYGALIWVPFGLAVGIATMSVLHATIFKQKPEFIHIPQVAPKPPKELDY